MSEVDEAKLVVNKFCDQRFTEAAPWTETQWILSDIAQ